MSMNEYEREWKSMNEYEWVWISLTGMNEYEKIINDTINKDWKTDMVIYEGGGVDH